MVRATIDCCPILNTSEQLVSESKAETEELRKTAGEMDRKRTKLEEKNQKTEKIPLFIENDLILID